MGKTRIFVLEGEKMKTLDKILGIIVLVCFIVIYFLYITNKNKQISFKKVVEENQTLRKTLDNPKVTEKPSIKYKETKKVIPKPVVDVPEDINKDEIIKYLIDEIERIFLQSQEVTKEVEIIGEKISEPIIPEKVSVPITQKDKKLTGLIEYKFGDNFNFGIAHKVYKNLSLGGSINTNGTLGLLGLVKF